MDDSTQQSEPCDAKKLVYICYHGDDSSYYESIKRIVTSEPEEYELLSPEASQNFHRGRHNIGIIHEQISESDIFILVISKSSLQEKLIAYEYQAAHFHHSVNGKPFQLICALIEDADKDTQMPQELISNFDFVDLRYPLNESGVDKAKVLKKLRGAELSVKSADSKNTLYVEAVSPNHKLLALQRLFRNEFESAFKEHVGKELKTLTDLRKAQDNLMTPELISIAEAQAYDDIWVVSHTLNNDLHDEEIKKSVSKNLQKGISYTYFVPKTRLIVKRKKDYAKEFKLGSLKPESGKKIGKVKFIDIEKGVFMPFDELVIYDGENTTQRWGYLQMSYEKNHTDPLTIRVPDRTLSIVIEYLKGFMSAADTNA